MEDSFKMGDRLCDLCAKNSVVYACNNEKGIIYLGNCCADEHFLKTDCNHERVELDHSQIIEEISEKKGLLIREMNQALLNYLGNVQAFRDRIETVQQDAQSRIENAVRDVMGTLTAAEQEIISQLELLDSDSRKTARLLNKFEKQGMSGVLKKYYKYIEDNYDLLSSKLDRLFYIANKPQEPDEYTLTISRLHDKILILEQEIDHQVDVMDTLRSKNKDSNATDYLTNKLEHYKKKITKLLDKNQELSKLIESLQTEIAENSLELEKYKLEASEKAAQIDELRQELSIPAHKQAEEGFIYIPRESTKKLIRYNIKTQSKIDIDCTRILPHNFNGTSVCVLPSNDVIIAGGRLPNLNDVYIYKVADKKCRKLANLNKARGHICLIYHRDLLYAIGGDNEKPVRNAECLKLTSKKWLELNKMNVARNFCSSVAHQESIFAIGGFNTDTIERFDVITNSWVILRQRIAVNGCVAGIIEDKVYIICKDTLFVTDLGLNIVETKKKCWNKSVRTLSNLVIGESSIYYFNRNCSKIEKFKSKSYVLKEVCNIQLIG
jgi:hypothetical protein